MAVKYTVLTLEGMLEEMIDIACFLVWLMYWIGKEKHKAQRHRENSGEGDSLVA